MKVLGIAGWSGSGKTTLVTALIGIFAARGFRVSSIKHAHHDVAFDKPGKDSYKHAQAGAQEVILAAEGGFALFSKGVEPRLEALLARLAPADLVLVEGYKDYDIPKIEVFRPSLGKTPLWPGMRMLAVASDAALEDCPLPVLDLTAPEMIADFVTRVLELDLGLRAWE
jgi:molybdopterin-guanine dinucleotide biosynthesis protein B